ncbi:MAG: TetR family transcriptional regulator [Aurantimonas endophytica]|uniref:acyl-CoA-like ligand-binding transcription factor n=1 Tax=Aurantimonas endophytica TaxID=1522175 RepID=UPI0030033CD2
MSTLPSQAAEALGLRERKKQATRATLSAVALRLALERGIDQVTVEEIAQEANVSLRTFRNYFPTKAAAIVDIAHNRADTFVAAFKARPAKEELWSSLTEALLALYPDEPDRNSIERMRLLRNEPALATEEYKADLTVQAKLAEAIAERSGSTVSSDIMPGLTAALVLATAHTALEFWLSSGSRTTLRETLSGAMHEVQLIVPSAIAQDAADAPPQR